MLKKLNSIGNSYGIIIPKAILDLLKINPVMDKVDFDVQDGQIIIKKAQKASLQ